MKDRRQPEEPKPEKQAILELNRETVQELGESQAEAARGGICYTQGGSCCRGEDSRLTK